MQKFHFQHKINSSKNRKDIFIIALTLFVTIFVVQTTIVGRYLINWKSSLSFVFFVGFELLFIGLAYDLTESFLALWLKPETLPKQSLSSKFPSVALLLTVCNDVELEVLEHLRNQTYTNYDIFILDDSTLEEQRSLVDKYGYFVLRRNTRHAYKAGNLNNWLDNYSEPYKYFVILDSDSFIPNDFISDMVAYAEHPQNQAVSVFQSKILPRNVSNRFSQVLSSIAPMRLYTLERVANRANMILSWGHNNLNRTDHIRQVGGFHEYLTPEDTTLSLMLSAKGYKTKLVDVISYDADPQNVFYYARRTIRWAKQTTEIFRLPWRTAPLKLKLLLCHHLYSYLMPNVYLGLLFITAWAFQSTGWTPQDFKDSAITYEANLTNWIMVLLILMFLWGVQLTLRLIIAQKLKIPFRTYFLHLLLANSIMYFLAIPIGIEIFRSSLGEKTKFTPSNENLSKEPTFLNILRAMWPSTVYGVIVVIGIILRNRFLLVSLNALWLFVWIAAPLVLWFFHRRQTSQEGF